MRRSLIQSVMQLYDLHHPDIPSYYSMENQLKITDFVAQDNLAFFVSYRQDTFLYRVTQVSTGQQYIFPVPRLELQDATLNAVEKSIMLMRYIRKALEVGELVPYHNKPADHLEIK